MASGQAGGRRHAQTDAVPDEDLSGGGGGVGSAASQDSQCCRCVGAVGGGEGSGDDVGGRWGGRVGGGLEESRGHRGGGVCRLVGLVKGCGGVGKVQAFENTWWT